MSTSARFGASAVLMVEPFSFQSNAQTGDDNYFQHRQEAHLISQQANHEWNEFRRALTDAGISVHVFEDHSSATPDSVFPNNWFSTHPDRVMCIYPMKATNRRLERRPEILAFLRQRYPTLLDLSGHEQISRFLEGTGSIVIDHTSRTAFAAMSSRTSEVLFFLWCEMLGYRPVCFQAEDALGRTIYHTNVCLSVNPMISFWVPDAIPNQQQRSDIAEKLSDRPLIELSLAQMESFCANVLVLQDPEGNAVLACSTGSWNAFSMAQQDEIRSVARPVFVPLETIEAHGGGGARCMIAELW